MDAISAIAALAQVAGTVSSIQQGNEMERLRQQQANRQKALYNQYQRLSSPGAARAGINALYQPLTEDLKRMLGRDVGGTMAARGADSPGLTTTAMAMALAPYEQKAQEDATATYFQNIGLPLQAAGMMSPAPGYPGSPNIGNAFASLAKLIPTSDPSAGVSGTGDFGTQAGLTYNDPIPVNAT